MHKLQIYKRQIEATHPLLLLNITWLIALSFWLLAPDHIIRVFFRAGRNLTFSSLSYLALFLIFFHLGFWFRVNRGIKNSKRFCGTLHIVLKDRKIAKKFIGLSISITHILTVIGLIALCVHIFTIFSGHYSIDDFNFYEHHFFRKNFHASSIQGITIFKFVSICGFLLATIGYSISKYCKFFKAKRKFLYYQIVNFGTPLLNLLLGTRSSVLLWIISYLYIKLGIQIVLFARKLPTRQIIRYGIIALISISILFASGEYLRRYSRISTGKLSAKPFIGIRANNLATFSYLALNSYFFRTINNGLVLVDNLKSHTYCWRLLRWLYSGLMIETIDPLNLIKKVKKEMYFLQRKGLGFFKASNSSLPGYLFIDLGWFAILMSFILGYLVSSIYSNFKKGAIGAWLTMPLITFGILESWQSDIIFSSVVMVPIVTSIFAAKYINNRLNYFIQKRL